MTLRVSNSGRAASRSAAALILLASSAGYAAEIPSTPVLKYDLSFAPAVMALHAEVTPDVSPQAADVDPDALECMAKVVHHESRGQPRKGQVAVAETLVNRLHDGSGRFGGSICAIANQRGQYFNTHAYHPARDTDDWNTAVEVARETLRGSAATAAPGALFFHAAYRSPSSFFRSRQRVTAIGGQIFYR